MPEALNPSASTDSTREPKSDGVAPTVDARTERTIHGRRQAQAGKLKEFTGSDVGEFNETLILQVIGSLWLHEDEGERPKQYQAALAAMRSIAPRDELEGMLAAQMVATHAAMMECYRRAAIRGQSLECRSNSLKHANQLARTYTLQLDALNRHRGTAGQQRVTVEHKHFNVAVAPGAQAVVGTVHQGGGRAETGDQPHASCLAYEPSTPMRGPDPERQAVPLARRPG